MIARSWVPLVAAVVVTASGCGAGTMSEAEFTEQYGIRDIDEVPFVGEDMLQGARARAAMDAVMERVKVTPSTMRLLSAHFSPTNMGVVVGVKGQDMAFDRIYVNVYDELIDPSPERVDEDDVVGRVFDGNAIPYDRFPAMRLAAAKTLGMTINQVTSFHIERREKDGDVVVSVTADDRRRTGSVTFSTEGVIIESEGGAPISATSTTTTVSGVTTSVTVETK